MVSHKPTSLFYFYFVSYANMFWQVGSYALQKCICLILLHPLFILKEKVLKSTMKNTPVQSHLHHIFHSNLR